MSKTVNLNSDGQTVIVKPLSDGASNLVVEYSQLIQECYVISKQTNTSYTDVRDNMTPRERREILKLIYDEFKQSQERMKEIRNK